MTVHDEVDDLLGAFALGSVTAPEGVKVRRHVAECRACTEALAPLTELVDGFLPFAVEAVEPPAGLRARVLAGARAPASIVPLRPSAEGETTLPRTSRIPRSWRYALAAAAAVVVGLSAWNAALQVQLGGNNSPVADLQHQTARGTLVGAHGTSAGTISYLASDHIALVSFHAMASPPPGKSYQLWVIPASGVAESAGVFVPDADGTKLLAVGRALSPADQVAVTVEPLGGSREPTMAPIITGSITPG